MKINELYEKNNLNCDIVQDLLPLYHDDVVSDSTKKAVVEHLSSCESCSEAYNMMCNDFDVGNAKVKISDKFMLAMDKLKKKGVIKGATIGASVVLGLALISLGLYATLFCWHIKQVPNDKIRNIKVVGFDIPNSDASGYSDKKEESRGKGWYFYYDMDSNYLFNSETQTEFDKSTKTLNICFKTPVIMEKGFSENSYQSESGIYNNVIADEQDFDRCDVEKINVNGKTVWTKAKDRFFKENELPDYVKFDLDSISE